MKTSLWLPPLIILMVLTPFSSEIDLGVSSFFYEDSHFSNNPIWQTIFDQWVIPALVVSIAACLGFLFSLVFSKLKPIQKASLFLTLVILLGSGLVIHGILKDHWGRPRPRQIIAFGGDQPFYPFYKPNFFATDTFKSFTCGHCSMGFYFLAVLRLGVLYRNKKLNLAGWVLTLVLGGGLSLARIAQGGHFFTDIFVSFCVMWWTTLFLEWVIFRERTN